MTGTRVTGMDQPRPGDAFGEVLRAQLLLETFQGPTPRDGRRGGGVIEIVERDDGFIFGASSARYLDPPQDWPDIDHRAIERCRGRVLDVGAGAGRIALELQDRGFAVTALDVSPGAVEVCRARGVRDTVCAVVHEHTGTYDTVLLLGNNLGLCGGRRHAAGFLDALARVCAPGGRVVAQGTDATMWIDPEHVAYRQRNERAGELGGRMRIRARHRDLATDWFDFLYCSPGELAALLPGTGWRIEDLDDADTPTYLAVLARD